MNERLFLEILDWNAKMVQCSNNIELKISARLDENKENLLQIIKIKKPRRPQRGQNIPLISQEKADNCIMQVKENLRLLQIFIENINTLTEALTRFNIEMQKIHQSNTVTEKERFFIHTTAKILKEKIPQFLTNRSRDYVITINKVNETLNSLTLETTRDSLHYQKEFSEYLVNCFNYITNAIRQINYRIDTFTKKPPINNFRPNPNSPF